ncbi:class I SAM-dependent methyltransferase [Enterococcus casseliflavus]|uniref:class I SAM-dependent methyltransferase n=1 Tax=Enterococcus casseliflavus TaxID=37734 RepID=UPI00178034F7|nr:class I SAM-dependent methyltransferase [Enterococcus casseliflavus]MCI1134760.1 class I SAM-dependent methyltransferase [Enterococcus gallinarum]QOG30878.1 class I SAM-dependent methyltransferase [Enterococcus casseliflavus]
MFKILDACCGSRMFWFDKENPNVTYMDIRQEYEELETGHVVNVNPDIVGDFRDMPFESDTFDMVVFDPPHLIHAGDNSWLAKKYGKLDELWPEDIRQGFAECMRVLKPNGSLIFKWNEDQISLQEVLAAIGEQPLFGNKRSKTHWLVFMK